MHTNETDYETTTVRASPSSSLVETPTQSTSPSPSFLSLTESPTHPLSRLAQSGLGGLIWPYSSKIKPGPISTSYTHHEPNQLASLVPSSSGLPTTTTTTSTADTNHTEVNEVFAAIKQGGSDDEEGDGNLVIAFNKLLKLYSNDTAKGQINDVLACPDEDADRLKVNLSKLILSINVAIPPDSAGSNGMTFPATATAVNEGDEALPFSSSSSSCCSSEGLSAFYYKDWELEVILELAQRITDSSPPSLYSSRLKVFLLRAVKCRHVFPLSIKLSHNIVPKSDRPSGGGASSEVYEGYYYHSAVAVGGGGKKVALKVLRYSYADRGDYVKKFEKEAVLWRQLRHRNVLPFLGLWLEDSESAGGGGGGESDGDMDGGTAATATNASGPGAGSNIAHSLNQRVALVSPWAELGDLKMFLKRKGHVVDRVDLSLQIARGLHYLHTQTPIVIHGDFRPANIVVNVFGIPQVADFGYSNTVNAKGLPAVSSQTSGNGGGCPESWMAPELFNPGRFMGGELMGQGGGMETSSGHRCTKETDVYAYGMTIYEVFADESPFSELPFRTIMFQVGFMDQRPQKPGLKSLRYGLTDPLWKLITDCWNILPRDRPPMEEVVRRLEEIALDWESAREANEKARRIWRRQMNPPMEDLMKCDWREGDILYAQGRFEEAIEIYAKTKEACLDLESWRNAATCSQKIGELSTSLGRHEEAEKELKEARKLLQQLSQDMASVPSSSSSSPSPIILSDVQVQLAECTLMLAEGYIRQGDPNHLARELISEASETFQCKDHRLGQGACHAALGKSLMLTKSYVHAEEEFVAAFHDFRLVEYRFGVADCLYRIARALYHQGDFMGAKEKYERTAEQYGSLGMEKEMWQAKHCVAKSLIQMPSRIPEAIGVLEETVGKLKECGGGDVAFGRCLQNLANALRMDGQFAKAHGVWMDARDVFEKLGDVNGVEEIETSLSQVTLDIAHKDTLERFLAHHSSHSPSPSSSSSHHDPEIQGDHPGEEAADTTGSFGFSIVASDPSTAVTSLPASTPESKEVIPPPKPFTQPTWSSMGCSDSSPLSGRLDVNTLMHRDQLRLNDVIPEVLGALPRSVLPRPPPKVYGREQILHKLGALVLPTPSEGSKVVLYGTAASGKSTVATSFLHDNSVVQRFREHRYRVPCYGITTFHRLISQLGAALKIRLPPTCRLQYLAEGVRRLSRPVIICLDDLDSVWDTSPRIDELRELFSFLTTTTVLVTTRSPKISSGNLWDLSLEIPILTQDASKYMLRQLSSRNTAENVVTELIQLAGCRPLVLDLLAKLLKNGMSIQAVTKRLTAVSVASEPDTDKLKIVTRVVLESPFMAEHPLALRFLTIIALHPDGISLEKILIFTKVAKHKISWELNWLESLSLIYTTNDKKIAMPNAIREYFEEEYPPSSDDESALHRFYRNMIEAYSEQMAGDDEENLTLDDRIKLAKEAPDLRRMLKRFLLESTIPERIGWSIFYFTKFCKANDPDVSLLSFLLTEYDASLSTNLRASSQQLLGEIYQVRGRYRDAFELLEKARWGFRGLPDDYKEALCLHTMAGIDCITGNFDAAKVSLKSAREIFLRENYPFEAARCLCTLSDVNLMEDHRKEASMLLLDSKKQFLKLGDELMAARCQQQVGQILLQGLDYTPAADALQTAWETFERIGYRHGAADCSILLAEVSRCQGDRTRARKHLRNAMETFEADRTVLDLTKCDQAMGYLFLEEEAYAEAEEHIQKALHGFVLDNYKYGEASCLHNLGSCRFEQQDYAGALELFERAGVVYEYMEMTKEVYWCKRYMGECLWQRSEDAPRAIPLLVEAIRGFKDLNEVDLAADSLLNLGNAYRAIEERELAKDALQAAVKIFRELGDKDKLVVALTDLASQYDELGDKERGQELFWEARSLWLELGDENMVAWCDA